MCMDGIQARPPGGMSFGPMSMPGIQINRAKPDLTYRQSSPLSGGLGGSLVKPDLNRSGLENQQVPMSTKLPPGTIPPPAGNGTNVPAQGAPGGPGSRRAAPGDGAKGVTMLAHSDKDGGSSSQSLPAHGDTIPAKSPQNNAGKLTTRGSGRSKIKKKDEGDGAIAVTLPAHGDNDSGKAKPSLGPNASVRPTPTLEPRTTPTLKSTTRTTPSFITPLSPYPGSSSGPPKIR